MLNSELVI